MEIKLTNIFFCYRKKILLLLMRAFLFLFCTMVFSLTPKNAFSQNVKINIVEDKVLTVDEVFDLIMRQTEYVFIYKAGMFKDFPRIKLESGTIRANKLLEKSLANNRLKITISNDNIVFIKEMPEKLQQKISGVVTDSDNLPLPGVTVLIEGTSRGTLTDFDGNYAILAREGETLIFTYVGQNTEKRIVGSNTVIHVKMTDDTEELEEVVLTGQGISKKQKAIGYAVTTVKSALIEDRTEGDLARVLSGKVAGLNVTNSTGFSGSGTNIVIRGLTSFTGSNQALFVVDGVPFRNDITQASGGFYNNNQSTNRAFDIDPNDIAEVQVLKGLAAATLYGAEGSNGVILITTKSGSGIPGATRSSVSVSQSTFINAIATKPDYQNKYGQGSDGKYANTLGSWGASYDKDGPLGWGVDPNIDENGNYPHPFSSSTDENVLNAFSNLQGARLKYQPQNSFDEFFKPGIVKSTSISANGNSADGSSSFSTSIGYLDDDSFIPGNSVKRTNISVGGRSKIADKLTVSASMRYSNTNLKTPRNAFDFDGGDDRGGIYPLVLIAPRSLDITNLPYKNPIDNSSVYYRTSNDYNNPKWLAENLKYNQITDRYFWTAELNYALNKKTNIKWRTGRDVYYTNDFNTINKGGKFTQSSGFVEIDKSNGASWNHLLTVTGNYKLSKNIGASIILGGNAVNDVFESVSIQNDEQDIFGLFLLSNFKGDLEESAFMSERNQVGFFGDLSLDYKNFLYLNVSARKDWVSNLQKGFNSATYPSASLSFLPTEAFKVLKAEKGLNYLKLRSSYGTSTRFPSGYPIDFRIGQNTNDSFKDESGNSISVQTVSGDKDAEIVPEFVKEWEFGLEAKFFKNRGTLDFSYFDKRTEDIISTVTAAPSTGNFGILTNTGAAKSSGVEISLGFDIVKSNKFKWNSTVNFTSHNETFVKRENDPFTSIGNNRSFSFGGFGNIGQNAAVVGRSLGAIVGTRLKRNEDGVPIIDSRGYYITERRDENNLPFVVGDAIPDYRMNVYNTFNYKDWTFSFMVHHTKGGDLFTQVPSLLLGRGLIKDNLKDHENLIVISGVTESGEPNTVAITGDQYWRLNVANGATELKIYDASLIRLQEMSLGYSLPSKTLDKLPFNSLSIIATGYNLYHRAYNTPKGANIDTNTTGPGPGNNRGIDYSSSPGSRRYGITLKASF